jgi:hypothetical protein
MSLTPNFPDFCRSYGKLKEHFTLYLKYWNIKKRKRTIWSMAFAHSVFPVLGAANVTNFIFLSSTLYFLTKNPAPNEANAPPNEAPVIFKKGKDYSKILLPKQTQSS